MKSDSLNNLKEEFRKIIESSDNYKDEDILNRLHESATDALHDLVSVQHNMHERVKELSCLHSLSELINIHGNDKDEVFKQAVNLIAAAWHYPEITCARISTGKKSFTSENFRETEWRQSADIFQNDKSVGKIEVFFLEEKPELDEGPFLEEERKLINTISLRLSHFLERHHLTGEIEKHQRYLSIMLKSIGDAVIATDKTGRVTEMNEIAEKLTGWSSAEAIGKDLEQVFRIFNAITGDKTENPIARVLKTGNIVGLANHTKLISKSGVEYHIADSGAPIKDEKGKIYGVVLVFRDVTDEYRQQQYIRESEQQMDRAQKIGNMGSWVFDFNKGTVKVSQQSCKIYGLNHQKTYTIKELQKIPLKKYREALDLEMENLIKNNSSYDIEFQIRRPTDNKIIDIHSMAEYNPVTNQATGIIRDISREKEINCKLTRQSKAMENAMDGIAILDSDHKYIYMNQAHANIYGYNTPEELVGASWKKLYKDEHLKKFQAIMPELLQLKKWRGEATGLKKDGSTFYQDVSLSLLEDESLICIVRDITVQKENLARIDSQKHRLTSIIEGTSTGTWEWNIQTGETICNEQWAKMIGYTLDELSPATFDTWAKLTHPEDLKKSKKLLQANLNGETQNYFSEIRMRHKEGHWVWIISKGKMTVTTSDGKPLWMYGTHQDITDIKEAEAKLRESEERFRLIFDGVKNIAVQGYDRYGNVCFWNQANKAVYGYTPGEAEGKNVFDLVIPPEEDKALRDIFTSAFQNKEQIPSGEYTMKRKDGSRVPVYSNFILVNVMGKYEELYRIDIDLTEKNKTKNELITAKEKAEESDRLKSAFLANMSHEIRTPMNGILGFTNLLQESAFERDRMLEYLSIIERSGERMLNTINDLIDISKIESGAVTVSREQLNVNSLMYELYSFFRPEAVQKGLELIIEKSLPEEEAIIETDRKKLSSVITNLIKNALKYTDQGRIKIRWERKADELVVTISDTGIGIPDSRKHAIFERFVQADLEDREVREGSGLGLAITKSYVEMLKGNIDFSSSEGKGSVFWFSIPLKQTEVKTELSGPLNKEPQLQDLLKESTVLIVEDEEISELYLTELLSGKCREILHSCDGLHALELVKSKSDIDIILLDIKLPGMNGFELATRIRHFNRDVLIIAQSAYAHEGIKQKALDACCDDYISKPIRKQALLDILKKHL